MRFVVLYLSLFCALFAQATKVGGSGKTKVGGSGTTKVFAATGTSYTLLDDYFTSTTSTWPVGDASGSRDYSGLLNWTNASARNIGKITAKLQKTAGTIVGKTYVCKIWNISSLTHLNTLLATSTGVAGSDSWSATSVDFIFSTPYATTGGVLYAITFDCGSTDASNYASLYYTAQVGAVDLAAWDSGGANSNDFSSFTTQLKIYTSP